MCWLLVGTDYNLTPLFKGKLRIVLVITVLSTVLHINKNHLKSLLYTLFFL